MRLSEILRNISYRRIEGPKDRSVDLISSDSRFLSARTLFIIKDGRNFSGIRFVNDIKSKVTTFISEEKHVVHLKNELRNTNKTLVIVDSVSKVYRSLSLYLLGKAPNVKIIGITGTNGKTTTAYLLWHILNSCHRRASLVSTINYILSSRKKIESFLTTPDLLTFANLVYKTSQLGGRYLVSEISSHALAQGRIKGAKMAGAIFTNLTEDHLDYHLTLDNYFRAKSKIFNYLLPEGIACLNIDDDFAYRAYRRIRHRRLSFGLEKGDLQPRAWRVSPQGVEILIEWKGKKYFIRSRLKGEFNIYNILAALGCAFGLGVKPPAAVEAVNNFSPPPGRMEEVKRGVFVDYAHTPDALEEALICLKRDLQFKKVILVFGCGGEREKKKRLLMGRIASSYADYCIVTSDNPRRENPAVIIKQIVKGLRKKKGCLYEVIPERETAIKKALKIKKDKSTAVLIAGKGHETYQIIGVQRFSFSDQRVVESYS